MEGLGTSPRDGERVDAQRRRAVAVLKDGAHCTVGHHREPRDSVVSVPEAENPVRDFPRLALTVSVRFRDFPQFAKIAISVLARDFPWHG